MWTCTCQAGPLLRTSSGTPAWLTAGRWISGARTGSTSVHTSALVLDRQKTDQQEGDSSTSGSSIDLTKLLSSLPTLQGRSGEQPSSAGTLSASHMRRDAQAAASTPPTARSPASATSHLPFSTTVTSITARHVTHLEHFEAEAQEALRQLKTSQHLSAFSTARLAVHLKLGSGTCAKISQSPSSCLPSKGLAVSSITVCYDTEQQPAAGDTSHELSAVVFEFPEGCLQPTAPDHAAARTALTALWNLMSSYKVVKVVHDGKSLHRLGVELGLGVANQTTRDPDTPPSTAYQPPVPTPTAAPLNPPASRNARPAVPETATRRRGRKPSTASSSPAASHPSSPPPSASFPTSAPEDPMSTARPLGFTQGCISGVCAPILDTMLACYLADLERNKESELSVGVLSTGFSVQTASELQAKVTGLTATATPAALAAAATTAQIWALATQLLKHTRVHVDMPALLKTIQTPNHVPDAADRLGPTAAGWKLLTDLEQPLQEIIACIEKTGVLVDKDVMLRIERDTVARQKEVEAAVHRIADNPGFNLNSAAQISDLLFNKLALPTMGIKKTSTGQLSTDETTLRTLSGQHEVVGLIAEYRSLKKKMDYLYPLLAALEQSNDGRVHTTFHQTGTVTGRITSTDPNLQNIPKHDSFYAPLLDAYKPEPGWLILNADYAQMELRQLAALSGEQPMVEAFRTNQDVHKETARLLFGLASVDQVTKEQRQIGKVVNFAIIYGMGPVKLARDLGHGNNLGPAKEYIRTIHAKYPEVYKLLRMNQKQAVVQGFVETKFGRRRYFEFESEELRALQGMGMEEVGSLPSLGGGREKKADADRLRQAANFAIQGTSADIMKRAMVLLQAEILRRGLKSRMLLTIHDALVLEVPPEEVDTVRTLVQQCMDGADGGLLSLVPLKSEIKVNETFKQAYC